MRLELKDITIFTKKEITFPDKNRVFIYTNTSATGKTTIARVLYAFATGRVDTSLRRLGAEKGEAILTLGSRDYILEISDEGTKVERITLAPWSGFLVLTEATDLYPVYISPPMALSIEPYLNDIVPPPKELAQLPSANVPLELQQIEKQILHYQTSLHNKEKALQGIEAKLRSLSKASSSLLSINLSPYYRVRELESKIQAAKKKLEELSNQITSLEASIDREEYSRLKQLHNKYESELMRLREELDRYAGLYETLERIRRGFKELSRYLDMDISHKIVLCSQIVTPDFLASAVNDAEASIAVVSEKIKDINSKIEQLEAKKAEIDARLQEITRAFLEYETLIRQSNLLKTQLQRYQEQLRSARIQLSSLLKRLGVQSVEELEKLMEEKSKIVELVKKREELERERQRLLTDISSMTEAIRALEERRRELLAKEEEFNRLKKAIAEKRRRYMEKVSLVREHFKESLYYFLSHFEIPDFNIEAMQLLRPGKTYSQAERFIIALGIQYAIVSTLIKLGYTIPYVVIDIMAPMDSGKERRIVELFKELVRGRSTQVVFLKTADEERLVTVL